MRNLPDSGHALIFQHIPKTAGTTLSFIIKRYFDPRQIYHIRNLQQLKGPSYSKHFGSMEDFANLQADRRNQFRCIMGHMPFGLHRHIQSPFHYIAFVRDPVKRVISQFGQHQRMIQTGDIDGRPLSLEAFLALKPAVLNNHQTHFLSGMSLATHSAEACYQKARENIDSYFALLGVAERFDESVLLLSKIFHWPNVTYFKRNIGTHRPPVAAIDPNTIEKIRKANQYDASLYQYAVQLLNDRIRLHGTGFEEELQDFRRKQDKFQKKRQALHRMMQLANIARKSASALLRREKK